MTVERSPAGNRLIASFPRYDDPDPSVKCSFLPNKKAREVARIMQTASGVMAGLEIVLQNIARTTPPLLGGDLLRIAAEMKDARCDFTSETIELWTGEEPDGMICVRREFKKVTIWVPKDRKEG